MKNHDLIGSGSFLARFLALVGVALLTASAPSCSSGGNADAGQKTDSGPQADGGQQQGADGGHDQPDGSVDDDGGPVGDGGCISNPRNADDFARGCTTSFKIPVTRTPPCAPNNNVPALGSDLSGCVPADAGPRTFPDGGSCYALPDGG